MQKNRCTIYNVTLTAANTEYSQLLPDYTKDISIQCRTAYDVRFAFVTGKVATPTAPYATIKNGGGYGSDNMRTLETNPQTLYLASAQAGVVVEIVVWQ